MEDKEFEKKVRDYLKANLSIDVNKIHGSYGSASYVKLELKLGEEVISEAYIND